MQKVTVTQKKNSHRKATIVQSNRNCLAEAGDTGYKGNRK